MPQKFSQEKQQLIEFMGGKVLRTPTEDGMKGAIAAVQIRDELGKAWIANQFSNSDNPLCHYQTVMKSGNRQKAKSHILPKL